MAKSNIATEQLLPWDEYRDRPPEAALASIYGRIAATARQMCDWYWKSIKTKRRTSFAARGLSFVLLTVGTALPIIAATLDAPGDRLQLTQTAVAMLAVAGLIQVADRVFGWSSGWMRYIVTATTMENLTRAFELEWANYMVLKGTPLEHADVEILFTLGRGLEQELTRLQAEETTKWVAEFNSSISLLESLIKTQREETDRKLEVIRTTLVQQAASRRAGEGGERMPVD